MWMSDTLILSEENSLMRLIKDFLRIDDVLSFIKYFCILRCMSFSEKYSADTCFTVLALYFIHTNNMIAVAV